MHLLTPCILVCCLLITACTDSSSEAPATMQRPTDSLSYAIGVSLGRSYAQQRVEIDPQWLALGVEDQMRRGKLLLPDTLVDTLLVGLQRRIQLRQEQARREQATANLRNSQQFLLTNRQQSGIRELPSGIQYRVLREGEGASPRLTHKVQVSYVEEVLLTDGFEQLSEGTGTFSLREVIPGWADALINMKPGDRWEIYVPPQLAYGQDGRGQRIPPHALLKFDLVLQQVVE